MAAPPGLTSFANLRFARRLLADPRAPIDECTARFGPIWQSAMPGEGLKLVPLVWLMGQAGSERVLSPKHKDDFTWYEGYRFTMEPLFGRQILLLLDDEEGGQGDVHRQRQRRLLPAFHPRLDGEYTSAMQTIIDAQLDTLPTATPVDMQAAMKRLTFHVVAELLLGAKAGDLSLLRSRFEQLGLGLYSVVHLPIPGLPFYRAKAARKVLVEYLSQRLAAARRGEGAAPLLGSLLTNPESGKEDGAPPLSDDIIIAELISFLYAGYDTTSSLLTSLIAGLGEQPQVFSRLRAELRDRPADADCPYLEAVLLEAERLFPPILFALRGVRRDISFGGFDIKAGSKVAYSAYYTGRQESLFSDPLSFRPERFLDENGALKRPAPYTVLGFGGGHRICIGKRFAGLELRLVMSRLLRRFDLRFLPQKSDVFYCNPAPFRKHGYFVELVS